MFWLSVLSLNSSDAVTAADNTFMGFAMIHYTFGQLQCQHLFGTFEDISCTSFLALHKTTSLSMWRKNLHFVRNFRSRTNLFPAGDSHSGSEASLFDDFSFPRVFLELGWRNRRSIRIQPFSVVVVVVAVFTQIDLRHPLLSLLLHYSLTVFKIQLELALFWQYCCGWFNVQL
jgi:hypothetical protein